jgi:hypothetical protein
MTKAKKRLALRIAMALGIAASILAMLFFGDHYIKIHANGQSGTAESEPRDPVSRMVKYTKEGRYDDAIQLGLQSIQNEPSDEALYQQIAIIYLIRANKEPGQREQWVVKAVSYIEKSLLLNSMDKDAAGVHLFQDARSFELAGDLSTTGRCVYYGRARKLLEDRIPLLQGDHLTLEGRSFPLGPLRKENEKALSGVKEKATKAGCK